jgi:hypothetical protein
LRQVVPDRFRETGPLLAGRGVLFIRTRNWRQGNASRNRRIFGFIFVRWFLMEIRNAAFITL